MKKIKKLLFHAIYLVVGGICGIFMVATFAGDIGDDRAFFTHMAISLIILLVAFFVQIIIHEAGHLVFGLLTGYKFVSFRVGSLLLTKEGDRLTFKIYSVVGTGGQCLMMPPPWQKGMPFVLYNLGGCFANLVTGILFLGLFFVFGNTGVISLLIGMLGVIGIANVLINGIPMEAGGIANDGKNALTLGKNEVSLWAFWLQLYVNGLLAQGERMSNMPAEWFFLPKDKDLCDPIICSVGVMKYNYDLDCKNFAAAEEDIEYMLKAPGLLGLYKNELSCERIFLRVFRGAPQEEVEPLFTKELKHYLKATSGYLSRQRLNYAVALLYKKDYTLAQKILNDFNKAMKHFGYSADAIGEAELVELVTQKSEQQ